MTQDDPTKATRNKFKAPSGPRIREPYTGPFPLASEERVAEIQAYLGDGITFSPVRKRKLAK